MNKTIKDVMTYIVEIASKNDTEFTLEKFRATSKEEAVNELKKAYGQDAIIGYIKAVY